MTETSTTTNSEPNISAEQFTAAEQAFQKNAMNALTSNILADVKSGEAKPLDTKAFMSEMLGSLAGTDNELGVDFSGILDDPEIAGLIEAYDRINAGNPTAEDIELFNIEIQAPAPDIDIYDEKSKSFITKEIGATETFREEDRNIAEQTALYIAQSKATKTTISKGFKLASTITKLEKGLLDKKIKGLDSEIVKLRGLKEKKAGFDTAGVYIKDAQAVAGLGLGAVGVAHGADLIGRPGDDDKVKGQLTVASSSLGIAKSTMYLAGRVAEKAAAQLGDGAVKSVVSAFSKKLTKEGIKAGAGGTTGLPGLVKGISAGSKATKAGAAFVMGVGSLIAIGAGALSMTKNAMAANEARENGQVGQAAVLGIQAGLDGVGMILDVASLIMDFVPGPGTLISAVLDIVNLGITGINIGLGFLLDVVVDKTDLQDKAWEQYLNSADFKKYIDGIGDTFQAEGYDMLEVLVDTENTGVGDFDTGRVLDAKVERRLSDAAESNPHSDDLRLAILDQTIAGHTLHGRNNDDYIDGGQGNDTIYGHGGDDILIGGSGDDRLFGGKGDDAISGGAGRDEIYGEEGNDFIDGGVGQDTVDAGPGDDRVKVEIGIDDVDAGTGDDTLLVTTPLGFYGDASKETQAQYVIDLAAGKAFLKDGDKLDSNMVKGLSAAEKEHIGSYRWGRGHFKETDNFLMRVLNDAPSKKGRYFEFTGADFQQIHFSIREDKHESNNNHNYYGIDTHRHHWRVFYNPKTDQVIQRYWKTTTDAGGVVYAEDRLFDDVSHYAMEYLTETNHQMPEELTGYERMSYLIAALSGKLGNSTNIKILKMLWVHLCPTILSVMIRTTI